MRNIYATCGRTECVAEQERLDAKVAALEARCRWQPIETAPKDRLIDIWIWNTDGGGTRWSDCYYDTICDQWRTSRPSGHIVFVRATAVTHWMKRPEAPTCSAVHKPGAVCPACGFVDNSRMNDFAPETSVKP